MYRFTAAGQIVRWDNSLYVEKLVRAQSFVKWHALCPVNPSCVDTQIQSHAVVYHRYTNGNYYGARRWSVLSEKQTLDKSSVYHRADRYRKTSIQTHIPARYLQAAHSSCSAWFFYQCRHSIQSSCSVIDLQLKFASFKPQPHEPNLNHTFVNMRIYCRKMFNV